MNAFSGWTIEETKELFRCVSAADKAGKGLKCAFEEIALKTGRKPNSVRNYYYAQAKTLSMVPDLNKTLGIKNFRAPQKPGFVTFSEGEVEELIAKILCEQAKGRSVRAITTELACGDKTVMLRLQNKYRSIVFARRRYAERIMERLSVSGAVYYNPYSRRVVEKGVSAPAAPLAEGFKKMLGSLEGGEGRELLSGLASLAERAESVNHAAAAKADALTREVEKLSGEVERLKEENAALSARRRDDARSLTDAALSARSTKIMQLNEYFLAKEDKDKIKSLGEYVSELGKLLGKADAAK